MLHLPTHPPKHVVVVLQGPNAELRKQVQRGRVQTPTYGEVPLDYDPDQLQVRACTVSALTHSGAAAGAVLG